MRSRNNSTSGGPNDDNSLESILKRRSSLEDIEVLERSSPEPQVWNPFVTLCYLSWVSIQWDILITQIWVT